MEHSPLRGQLQRSGHRAQSPCTHVPRLTKAPHIVYPCGGRLTPHSAAPSTKGFWRCDWHPPGSQPLDRVQQGLIEEVVLRLGISCAGSFCGETPSPWFCHDPSERFSPQKDDTSTRMPAAGQRKGKWHYLHADAEPSV